MDVDGRCHPIRAWGAAGQPGLVLVHGGAAHSRWWDISARSSRRDRRVVALDLSGHGDSDTREHYSLDQWAHEVAAVASASGIEGVRSWGAPSMGGIVYVRRGGPPRRPARRLCRSSTRRSGRAPPRRMPRAARPRSDPRRCTRRGRRRSPASDSCRRRRRLGACVREHVAEDVAHGRLEGGWSWKFDPAMFTRSGGDTLAVAVPRCPIAYFRAQHGIVSDELMGADAGAVRSVRDRRRDPRRGHHTMIDQPLAS
ncbi:alpha/beta fold hydrolase [Rhodococcus hoagii]|nr:alpha/beta fold hydrolase [Prescottella equi]